MGLPLLRHATDLGVAGRMTSPALVCRDRELSQLVAATSAAPAVVVVEGEAGVGKTRLVSELRDRLGKAGHGFGTGWCRRIREPFPLVPIIEAVRALADELAGAALSPLAGALRPLLPELADRLPPAPPALDDRPAERHRIFRALVDMLGSLGPVALVIEDLHWADQQTIDFLSYLLADVPAALSVVATFRGEEVDPAVRALPAKLPASVRRVDLRLAPLDEQQTGVLAAAILGTERVSRDLAGYLHGRTSGLPFAIEELLALLQTRGALAGPGATWSRQAVAGLDVPARIRDSVLERVWQLSPRARAVVEAASVLQEATPVPVLAGTCLADEAPALEGVEEALGSGLLVEGAELVGFRHLLAAQAVYEAMPVTRRRKLHRRAASSIATAQPTPLGQLAHHLRRAGQVRAWVAAAQRAADQAVSLGDDDEAVRLLEEVLRHAPLDHQRRGRIAVKLAQAAMETLHVREVRELLLSVPTAELPQTLRGELRFWLGVLLDHDGRDPPQQRQLFGEAVADLAERPDLRALAMVGLGVPAGAPDVPLPEHVRWLHCALETLPELDSAWQVLVLGKVAMVLTSIGDPIWQELTERMLALTEGPPRHRREVRAFDSVGIDACYAGHHTVADRLLAAALAGASACHSRRLELQAQARIALLDYCRGRWSGLRQRAGQLVEELADYPQAQVDVQVTAACLMLAHGELDAAQGRLQEVVRCVEQMEGADLLPIPVAALLRLGVAREDVAPALATARRAFTSASAKGVWSPAVRLLAPITQAMVSIGDVAGAEQLVEQTVNGLQGLDAPLAAAAVPHARGLVAAGREQWLPGTERLLAAAARYERLSCPYEAAQAREEAAVCLYSGGDPRAERPLRQALAGYQRLGATWDGARLTRLARRFEVSLPAPHRGGRRGYGDQLSPREREVARLAAAGLTNEEIARDLFLSPKTVDKHVGAALRKLGLHSRRLLSQRLDLGDAPVVGR